MGLYWVSGKIIGRRSGKIIGRRSGKTIGRRSGKIIGRRSGGRSEKYIHYIYTTYIFLLHSSTLLLAKTIDVDPDSDPHHFVLPDPGSKKSVKIFGNSLKNNIIFLK